MKNVGRISSRTAAGMAGAITLLTAAPHFASAQAVGRSLRPDGRPASTPAQSAPAQPQSAPQSMPMRSGAIFARPMTPSETPARNTGPVYTNNPVFNSERPSGPAVVIPDERETSVRSSNLRYRRQRPIGPTSQENVYSNNPIPPVGPANGFFNNSTPPVGPANGFFNNSTPPAGPGNGFFNSADNRPVRPVGPRNGYANGFDLRIITARGPQYVPPSVYRNTYIYNNYTDNTVIADAPPLLGGYYYSNYCNTYSPTYTYPSVYCTYDGFPRYIFNPTVIVIGQPYYPVYATPFLPFYTPSYPVTYNQNNYYVTNENRVADLEAGGDRAQQALRHAYPADSYQAAFGDIARAWIDSDIAPLRKHIRNSDMRISILLNKKYSYSIASGDFVQITRDALDRLNTISFDFTRLRKAKNGDVTAYGTHVYRVGNAATGVSDGKDEAKDGDTVPFDQSDSDKTSPYDRAGDPIEGAEKTVYVSYTLRHRDTQWYIIAVDSADHDLASER